MSIYIDRRYLLLTSSRFRNFKTKKDDLFNFSCPFCGDSQKNQHRARGYVYRKDNDYFYMCHNCNVSTTFGKLLQHIDPNLYREYILERYSAGDNKYSPVEKPKLQEYLTGPKPVDRYKSIQDFSANSIQNLPDGHYAKDYIKNRRIPEKYWNEIFFTESYKKFLDDNFPNHGKEKLFDDARIVMFYTNRDGMVTNVTGRSLEADSKIRYITVKLLDEKKIYGMHRLDLSSRVYITEGQFDSLFLPNSVASGDSNLIGLAEFLKKEYGLDDVVLVFDNQPRNKDIVRQIRDATIEGYPVVFLPYDPDAKDLNDMVRSGMDSDQLKHLIDNNVYSGLTAQLKLNEWRKC